MKTNMINTNSVMKTYMKYICAVLLLIGTSAHAWGADPSAPSANYTLIKSVGSLSTNDRVILYCPALGTAVSGLSTCNSSTEASMSSTAQMWVEYKVTVVDASTIKLQDTRLSSNNYIYNNSGKFQYAGSGSATALSITSGGVINAGGTNLNAKDVGTGACERASARFASGGSPIYVFKVVSAKESKYSVSTASAELSITIDDDEGGMDFSSGELVRVTTTAGFVGAIYAELTGFSSPDVISESIYTTNSNDATNGFIINTANGNNGVYVKSWSLGGDLITNGTYQGYIHVYPHDGTNTTDEFYIPLTITVVNGNDGCVEHDVVYGHDGSGSNPSDDSKCADETVSFTPSPSAGYKYNGATIYEDDMTTQITTLNANTTSFSMYNRDVYVVVHYTAQSYTVSLDQEGGMDGTEEITVTYNSSTVTGFTAPTKEGYTFGGYYTGDGGTGTQVLNASGVLQAGVSGYTGAGGIWTKTTTPTTLYANWTVHSNKLTLGSPTTVTISSSTPTLAEGEYANVNYGSTVTLAYSSLVDGRVWGGWKVTKDADGTDVTTSVVSTNTLTMPDYAITVTANTYGSFAFSCADWSITGPSGDIVFITSAASKTVRSQEAFHVSGSGLPHNTALTFTISPSTATSKFAFKKADGSALSTDTYGAIDADFYVYYTPGEGDTSDGLDEFTSLTVSVSGEPRTATIDTKTIIGRHLPANFVIAGKSGNKWYALPATMSTGDTPTPVEIAVDDINNPSIAYTAATNIYGLEGPTASNISGENGQYVRLTMSQLTDGTGAAGPAPLYASTSANIGKNGTASATSDLSAGFWWALTQKNTGITNAQDAKYNIKSPNNSNTLSIKNTFQWGLYASGVEELRLITASDIPFTEAEVVEWGQHSAIVEVDAQGIAATSVVAHLGEANSSAITLVQTKANDAKNKTSKYNYTVNFGDGIDFAAVASNGAMMTLEWKNGEAVKAMSNIVVPKIIATSATMSSLMAGDAQWETEVHVLPNVTLEANGNSFSNSDVMIKQLEIYPGATVNVTSGTLKVKTLALRNGWTRVSGKNYDVARLYVATDANLAQNAGGDVWYSDWYIDYDQYYPIAVPFPVATSSIIYKNSNSSATDGVTLRYYSGELRATNIQQNQDANWVGYTWGGTMPVNLEPSHGYIMTARRPSGKAFSIVRMPMTFSNAWTTAGEKGEVSDTHKDQVTVTAWGDESVPWYAKGWNIIANPYMALHQGELTYDDASEVIEYANIPDISFKEYEQLPIATTKLKPSSAFLVQAPKDGTVTFGATNRKASAPSFRKEVQDEALPTQKAYILLASDEAEDMMGILVSDKYSAEYEINADLEKLLGDGSCLRTYMHFNEMKMAYLAINPELAEQLIPVSVRITNAGEHTFSMHNASKVSELKGVYLTDFQTGDVTNLMEDSYSFSSKAGTISGRFAINAKVGERPVPTDLDIVGGDTNGSEPVKFIYREKVFILHNGVIYDATGKKVKGEK